MPELTADVVDEAQAVVDAAQSGEPAIPLTHVVRRDPIADDGPAERRRSLGGVRQSDAFALGGALVASLSLTSLLFTQIAPFNGVFGFVLVAYLAFLGFYALLVSLDEGGPAVVDRIVATVVHSLAVILLGALVCVVTFTMLRGFRALFHWNFFTQDLTNAGPLEPLTVGGINHAITGTLIQITIALMITVPLGITCAVFLNEIPGRFARLTRTVAEAMTALPSIIAGLFIYATFILALGFPKSGLAAALAISVMMLPIIIRAADVVLRLVPGQLKEASLALGTGQWRTVWHVTLPTARSGLATAVILGAARGIGETSPVLITAGYTASMNTNPLSGPMVSLPLAVFEQVKSPQANQISRGFATAVTLLLVVLVLFIVARIIGGRGPGNLTNRQLRKRMAASRKDAERIAATHASRPAAAAAPPAPVSSRNGAVRAEPPAGVVAVAPPVVAPGSGGDGRPASNGSANGASNGAANGAANGSANGASNGASNGAANGSANGALNSALNGAANGAVVPPTAVRAQDVLPAHDLAAPAGNGSGRTEGDASANSVVDAAATGTPAPPPHVAADVPLADPAAPAVPTLPPASAAIPLPPPPGAVDPLAPPAVAASTTPPTVGAPMPDPTDPAPTLPPASAAIPLPPPASAAPADAAPAPAVIDPEDPLGHLLPPYGDR